MPWCVAAHEFITSRHVLFFSPLSSYPSNRHTTPFPSLASPSRSDTSRDGCLRSLTGQENREAHLKQLREKLKAKEERARQVREKKRLLQAQGGQPVAAQ